MPALSAPPPARPAIAEPVAAAPPPAAASAPSPPAPEEPTTAPIVGLGALATPPALAPLWSRVIRTPGLSPILRAILTNSSLVSLDGGKAEMVSAPKFATGAPKWSAQIADLIAREHGSKVELAIRAAAGNESIPRAADASAESPAPSSDDSTPTDAPASRPMIGQPTEHPLVKHALEVFGGRIVDVQPRRRS